MKRQLYSVKVLNPGHYMFVYQITNNINNKRYIGKTVASVDSRFYQHKKNAEYGMDTYLCRAIRKYGPETFSIQILEQVDSKSLNERERFWISKLQPEYNMTPGGDGGWIHDQTGNTWRVKDNARMGRIFKEGRQAEFIDYTKNSGGNNYQSVYKIHTPWGIFDTWQEAKTTAKQLRSQGNKAVVTDINTLRKYCTENIQLNSEGRRTLPEWRGKFTQDIGFRLEKKNGSN